MRSCSMFAAVAVTSLLASVCAAQAPAVVSGYAELVNGPRQFDYPSFAPMAPGAFTFCRTKHKLIWRTAPAPRAGEAVFVFQGGQHHPGQCNLLVNGAFALSFRTSARERTLFCGPKARLLFDCKDSKESRGYTGLYYLRLDPSLLRPGQPLTLSVNHAVGSHASWFAVWKREDAVALEKDRARLAENLRIVRDFDLSAPARVPHAVGAKIPLNVRWRADASGDYRVEVFAKSLFANDFTLRVGQTTSALRAGQTGEQRFEFKNSDPEPMIFIFAATVAHGGRDVARMETETLFGSTREAVLPVSTQAAEPYKVRDTVKTPALAFLKPAAWKKPMDVFFITPSNYDREIVELAERMDLRHHSLFCHLRDIKKAKCEAYARAIEKADPECLVMSAIFWKHLTPQLRKLILGRVARKGMGFVYIDPYRTDEPLRRAMALAPVSCEGVTRGVPLEETGLVKEYGRPPRWIKCGRFGKGRIVEIYYRVRRYKRGWVAGVQNFIPRAREPIAKGLRDVPYRKDKLNYFTWRYGLPEEPFKPADEYSYAFLIRAMTWAARGDEPVTITGLRPSLGGPAAMVAKVKGAGTGHTLTLRVRDRFGRAVCESHAPIRSGVATARTSSLNSGRHYADALLKDANGKTVDFFSTVFDAPAQPLALTGFGPRALVIKENQPVRLTFAVANPGRQARSVKLRLSLFDGWQREVGRYEKRVQAGPGATPVTWELPRPDAHAGFAFRAALAIEGSSERAERHLFFPDDNREPREFTAQFWGGPRAAARAALRITREEGFLGAHIFAYDGAFSGCRMAVEHYIPLYARRSLDKAGRMRTINLDRPKVRADIDRLIFAQTERTRPLGLHGYSLGHESSLSHAESATHPVDYDFSPETLAKFREALRRQHGDVRKLNAAWQTSFPNFQKVVPWTYAEGIKRKSNLGPWMAHRKFMDQTLLRWLTHCAGRIRAQDPRAKVGITGVPSSGVGSFLGVDNYLHARNLNYTILYSRRRNQLKMYLRYQKPGSILGTFTGYDHTSPNRTYNLTEPWRYLFFGCTEISYYAFGTFHSDGALIGYFQPDLTVAPIGKWFGRAVREINDGPGKLLFAKPRAHHGVGVYFTQNGVHATTGMGIDVFSEWRRHANAAMGNLERFGLNPAMISNHEVEQNPACLKAFKFIVFPFSTSLSPREVKAIEAWVRGGGVALVDNFFGLYNEDGRFMPNRVCSWFEPVASSYLQAFDKRRAVTAKGLARLDGKEAGLDVFVWRGSPRRLRGGRPVADMRFDKPEARVVERRLGAGRVCAMTFTMPVSDVMARWLRGRAEAAGVRPALAVRDPKGGLVPEVQLTHIQGAGKDYFGLVYGSWIGRGKKTPARLVRRKPGHLYDVRKRRYLGEKKELEVALRPDEPLLYCRLPRPIGAFRVDAPQSLRRGRTARVAIRQSDARDPRLLYRVWLEPPDPKLRAAGGKPMPFFVRKVWIKGSGETTIPVAWSDPKGKWKLHVRETISGRTVSRDVNVSD